MILIEDTRQQKGEHDIKHKWFTNNDIEVLRSKLAFGDYALPPKVAVDTKKDMNEICGNICSKDNHRFKEECVRARDAGCKLIFLIENRNGIKSIDDVHRWVNPRAIYSPRCVQGARLEKAMKTMSERYGCEFYFCTPEESGSIIIKLLNEGQADG